MRKLRYSAAVQTLPSQDVVIEGLVSYAHGHRSFVLLVDQPGFCPDCSAGACGGHYCAGCYLHASRGRRKDRPCGWASGLRLSHRRRCGFFPADRASCRISGGDRL